MKKKILGAAAAIALAASLSVAAPTAANAALNCPGTRIDTLWIKSSTGTLLGKLGVYRTSDRKTWCAVVIKQGPVYGVATETSVSIEASRSGGPWKTDDDSGKFRYQTELSQVLRRSYAGSGSGLRAA